jgi:hypothetical protein
MLALNVGMPSGGHLADYGAAELRLHCVSAALAACGDHPQRTLDDDAAELAANLDPVVFVGGGGKGDDIEIITVEGAVAFLAGEQCWRHRAKSRTAKARRESRGRRRLAGRPSPACG